MYQFIGGVLNLLAAVVPDNDDADPLLAAVVSNDDADDTDPLLIHEFLSTW